MNLYYVRYDNEDGMNQDALVEADTDTEALGYWRDAFELDEGTKPFYIGEVPLSGKPGMISWELINKEDVDHG